MCLSTVIEVIAEPTEEVVTGYKLFNQPILHELQNRKLTTFFHYFLVTIGEWNQAVLEDMTKSKIITSEFDQKYPRGFHYYESLDEIQQHLRSTGSSGSLNLWKCEFRKVVAKGTEIYNKKSVHVNVAQEMRPIERVTTTGVEETLG